MYGIVSISGEFFSWYIDNGARIVELANKSDFDWEAAKVMIFDELLAKYRKGDIVGAMSHYCDFGEIICNHIGEEFPKECRIVGISKSFKFYPKIISYYILDKIKYVLGV